MSRFGTGYRTRSWPYAKGLTYILGAVVRCKDVVRGAFQCCVTLTRDVRFTCLSALVAVLGCALVRLTVRPASVPPLQSRHRRLPCVSGLRVGL